MAIVRFGQYVGWIGELKDVGDRWIHFRGADTSDLKTNHILVTDICAEIFRNVRTIAENVYKINPLSIEHSIPTVNCKKRAFD